MKTLSPRIGNGGTFDVVSYGADPTGATDSSPAFQAAANALVAFNATDMPGVLKIPPGKYMLNTTVILTGGSAVVEAYGAYIFAGSNNDLFRNYTSEDSTYTLNGRTLKVMGGIWDCKGQNWGNASNSTLNAAGFSAFTFSSASDILVRDVTIRNVYNYHGLDINTCDGVVLDNVKCEGFKNNFTWHTDVRLASATGVNHPVTGAVTVDGVAVVTNDRVLLKSQTTTSQNGIWVANTAGPWTRAADMDAAGEAQHAAVKVTAGTTNTGTSWYQSANNPTPGVAAMTWAQATGFNIDSRYFSEALQFDDGPNDIPCKNATVTNCYMGPATDGSGLGSFGKLVGSHTDSTNGLYTNMKVIGCTSVGSLSNAIQGYSWADATITDNVILGSAERGIRMTFNASNVGPRLSITGNMISETVSYGIDINGNTGVFGDVTVSENVITSTVMAATNNCGINVSTIDRITISNNIIQLTAAASSKQGINLSTINGGVVSGNGIYGAGDQGIQTTGVNRVGINNNYIYACGREGIWLTATSTKNMVSGNTIVGCGRDADITYGGITVSNASPANSDNSIIGNKFNKFGSGFEMLAPIVIAGTNPTDTNISANTFGGDWSTTDPFVNYALNGNTSVRFVGGETFIARATATTAVGTVATDIAGLTMTVPPGTWRFEAHVFTANTTLTALTATLVGPTTSGLSYHINRVSGTTQAIDEKTAFSSASVGTAPVMTSCRINGVMTVTTGGTFKVQMTRTGTTCTAQIGSYLKVEPVLVN